MILAVTCLGWGTIPLVVRHVDLPAVVLVAVRVWIATAVLGVIIAIGRRPSNVRLFSARPLRCVVASTTLALHWVAFFAAYQRASAGTVILVVYLAPIGVAAVAGPLLGERLTGRILVALALGVAGFILVAAPEVGGADAIGLALALLAAVTFAALVIITKPLAEAYGGLRFAFIQLLVAGVVLVPFAARAAWGSPSAAWWLLLLLGAGHTALGMSFYFFALARMRATEVAIMGYLEPVAVVVCAWLFLDESPAMATLVGGALVCLAGVLVATARGDNAPTAALEVPTVVSG